MKRIVVVILAILVAVGCGDSKKRGSEEDAPVYVVLDYLCVYPEIIGEYDDVPQTIIGEINKQKKYGIDNWRIPTKEELQLLKANGYEIDIYSYMCVERPSGKVQLVANKKELEKPVDIKDDDVKLKERNVLIVNVSKTGKIMVGSAARKAEYEPQDLERGADGHSRLSKETLDFLMLPEKSEKESTEIEPGKFYNLSKGIVSLMADKETKYSTYLQVQDELTHAFNCYRDEVSQDPKVYGKSYDELEDEQKEIMRKKVPPRISEAVPNDQTANEPQGIPMTYEDLCTEEFHKLTSNLKELVAELEKYKK